MFNLCEPGAEECSDDLASTKVAFVVRFGVQNLLLFWYYIPSEISICGDMYYWQRTIVCYDALVFHLKEPDVLSGVISAPCRHLHCEEFCHGTEIN